MMDLQLITTEMVVEAYGDTTDGISVFKGNRRVGYITDLKKDLAKQAKGEAEDAKISIRNARKDANNDIKKQEKEGTSEDVCKDAEDRIQKLTDAYIKKIDDIFAEKEAEIMKV